MYDASLRRQPIDPATFQFPAEIIEEVREAIAASRPDIADDDPMLRLLVLIQRSLRWTTLSVFARRYDDSAVLAQLPLHARAEVRLVWGEDQPAPTPWEASFVLPLGQVATDHVGYASFSLHRMREVGRVSQALVSIPAELVELPPRVEVALWVLPFGDDQLAVDAMYAGDVSLDTVALRLEIDSGSLAGRALSPPMPSMQNPGIEDWRLSPASFASTAARAVGEDGCDDFYPSDVATNQFMLSQLVLRDRATTTLNDSRMTEAHYGYLVDYRNEWYPVGHSLGQVIYSLPLAPGEKVNIAIADWQRTDAASRSEDVGYRESLVHAQGRNRLIGEVMYATALGRQFGSSSTSGFSLSGVVPMGEVLLGGTLSAGSASSSTNGLRTITADTTQRLSDGLQQTSSALRQLRSTVVTQVSQSEASSATTRLVANHNHCHAITMTYYELVRHYRVVTRAASVRPVLFVDVSPADPDFGSDEFVLAERAALEAELLDERQRPAFDALARKVAGKIRLEDAVAKFKADAKSRPDPVFHRFAIIFTTGSRMVQKGPSKVDVAGTGGDVALTAVLQNGTRVKLRQTEPPRKKTDYYFDTSRDDWVPNTNEAFVAAPDEALDLRDVRSFVVSLDSGDDEGWLLQHIRIFALGSKSDSVMVLDREVSQNIPKGGSTPELDVSIEAPELGEAPGLSDYVDSADLAAAGTLQDHLRHNSHHYATALLQHGDPVERWRLMRKVELNGNPLTKLVENTVVGRVGELLAFELTEEGQTLAKRAFGLKADDEPILGSAHSEDLLGLPTAGIFAEAMMGRCSSCERIDDTRFWDWQRSPVPGEAPPIAPVDTSSRYQAPSGLQASAMPGSVVSIAGSPAAPDPMAMANALQVLGKGDLFRDMSGSEQLGKLMQSMSEGTTGAVKSLAEANQKNAMLEKIMASEELTSDQKAKLAESLVSSGGNPNVGDDPSSPKAGQGSGSSSPGQEGIEPDGDDAEREDAAGGAVSEGEGETMPSRSKPAPPKRKPKPPRLHKPPVRTIQLLMRDVGGHPYRFEVGLVEVYDQSNSLVLSNWKPMTDTDHVLRIADRNLPPNGKLSLRDIRYVHARESDLSTPPSYPYLVEYTGNIYKFPPGNLLSILLRLQRETKQFTFTESLTESEARNSQEVTNWHASVGGEKEFLLWKGKLGASYGTSSAEGESESTTTGRTSSRTWVAHVLTGGVEWEALGPDDYVL